MTEKDVRSGTIELVLGGERHTVKVLSIIKSDQWLEKVDALREGYGESQDATAVVNEAVPGPTERQKARRYAKECLGLVEEYASDLPWATLRDTVTADEGLSAFDALCEATDPFVIQQRAEEAKEKELMAFAMDKLQGMSESTINKVLDLGIQKLQG